LVYTSARAGGSCWRHRSNRRIRSDWANNVKGHFKPLLIALLLSVSACDVDQGARSSSSNSTTAGTMGSDVEHQPQKGTAESTHVGFSFEGQSIRTDYAVVFDQQLEREY